MSTTTPTLPNDTRLADLMKETREFGRLMAQGKDSLPMLAIKVAQAAADGVITTDKDAQGEDDYMRIYADFMAAASKKAVHEHTSGGIKANASKLRQVGMAAAKPTCDFIDVLNRVVTTRTQMQAAGEKVKSAYPAYVDAARSQLAQDDDLNEEQIKSAVRKPDTEDPTEEKILTSVEKKLGELVTGDKGIKTQSNEVIQAYELVRSALAVMLRTREINETLARAKELGLGVVEQAA